MNAKDELGLNAPPVNEALQAMIHERWAVKTGADPDVKLIDTTSVTATTIADLIAKPVPNGHSPASPRTPPVETTAYSLDTTLVAYKWESDQDYHLVVSDQNGNTMIVEIPDPAAVDDTSPLKNQITDARNAFFAHFQLQLQALQAQQALQAKLPQGAQAPAPMITHVAVPLKVMGIGFFDFLHGQTGVAPNAIELHPVLSIEFP